MKIPVCEEMGRNTEMIEKTGQREVSHATSEWIQNRDEQLSLSEARGESEASRRGYQEEGKGGGEGRVLKIVEESKTERDNKLFQSSKLMEG